MGTWWGACFPCLCPNLPPADAFLVDAPWAANALAPGFPRRVLMDDDPWARARCAVVAVAPDGSAGAPVAFAHLPARGSFGEGATVVDAEGAPLAYLNSGEAKRRERGASSSYVIFAPRPYFPGQAPSANRRFWNGSACKEVDACYLWVRVVRSPLSDKWAVVDAEGNALGRGRAYADGFLVERPDATGAAWFRAAKATETRNEFDLLEGDARVDARVARGVDGLLAVCVKLARDLAEDELAPPPNGEYYSDEELDDVYSKSG
jgi:hypothetical protein